MKLIKQWNAEGSLRWWMSLFAVIAGAVSSRSEPLSDWTWRLPQPQNSVLKAVAHGNGLFVAVGSGGAVVISDNAIDWIPVRVSATGEFTSVTYGGGIFVCVGFDGTILSSADGVVWIRSEPVTTNRLNAVTFGNSLFVTVGNGGLVLTSDDAIHWTSRDSSTNQLLFDVAYGNGIFTALAPNARLAVTSMDGVTWTAHSTGARLGRLGYGNGVFVATTGDGIYSSPDGTAWTMRRPGTQAGTAITPVAYGNGIFVVVEGAAPRTWISNDGVQWFAGASIGGVGGGASGLAFGTGMFVAVRGTTIWATPDGLSWMQRTPSSDFSAITYGGGAFVAVGGKSGRSTNGIDWAIGISGAPFANVQSVTYGNGLYVALGHQDILTSTNGLDWALQTPAVPQSYSEIVFGNETFVALGGAGAGIQTSPNGTNWTLALPPINYLFGLAYGNGRFVAVGSDGMVLVSTDASHWTTNNAGTTDWLRGVSFANGLFIAGSESKTNYTSTDGSTWTSHPIGPDGSPAGGGILFCNGTYLSAGSGGVLSSSNGVDWVAHRSQHSSAISALACDGTTIVALANGGVLQSAPFDPTAPSVLASPQSRTVFAGDSPVLRVNAFGSEPLSYQWSKGEEPIVGGTNAILVLRGAQPADAGNYIVAISNLAGMATSAVAVVTVQQGSAPIITTQPQSQSATNGQTVFFNVATAGAGPISYQWRKDDEPIAGATNAIFLVASVNLSNAGTYTVVASNVLGSQISDIATLDVNAPSAPVISAHPQGQSVTNGGSVTFSVVATGAPVPTYQWRKNGTPLTGATNSSLALSNAQFTDGGGYSVLVKNPLGSVVSQTATLTVLSPPVIVSQPKSQAVTSNGTVTLRVSVLGSPPLLYQWYQNDVPVSVGTNAALVLTGVQLGQAGAYHAVISNSFGVATSEIIVLDVLPATVLDGWHQRGALSAGGSLKGVGYLNGRFVAVGEDRLLTSIDGTSWSSLGSSHILEDVSYGNGVYVTVKNLGGVFTSSDATNWTDFSSADGDLNLNDIVFANDKFVAVGWIASGGFTWISTDGTNWMESASRVSGAIMYGIAYGNGQYVIAASDQTIFTSRNAYNWTAKQFEGGKTFYAIAYGEGTFVAVGNAGMIYTSTNALDWIACNLGFSQDLFGVAYGNGLFVAVGDAGTVISSPDGLNWRTHLNAGTGRLYDVTAGNGTFVSVGSGPKIYQTDPLVTALAISFGPPVRLSISGATGRSYRIECADELHSTNPWKTLATVVLPTTPYFWIDPQAPTTTQRLYRAVLLP